MINFDPDDQTHQRRRPRRMLRLEISLPQQDLAIGKFEPRSQESAKRRCSSKAVGQRPNSSYLLPPSTKKWCSTSPTRSSLLTALGRNPADWVGAEVGLFTEPTVMAGKATRGLRLRVLNRPSADRRRPHRKPDAPWPNEAGDPGPDFIDAAE